MIGTTGKKATLAALALAALGATSAWATAYTPGDLVVTRLDDGGAALSNSGNSIYLDEFTTAAAQAAPVSTLTVPNVNGNPDTMVMSPTQSEGELRLSQDGSQLNFFAYNAYSGQIADIRKAANRTDLIGVVGSQGVLSYANSTTNAFNPLDAASHQIRSAYTVDDQNYYVSGDDGGNTPTASQSGVRYLASGSSTSTDISTAANQARYITTGPDGNLYAYIKGGTGNYASAIVNLGVNPTTNNSTPLVLVKTAAAPYNFNAVDAFSFVTFHTSPGFASGDLLYLSDDGVGILKYKYDGSAWQQDGANTVGGNFSLGMTLTSDGTNVTLYMVQGTGGGAVLSMTDAGAESDTAGAFGALGTTTLATAPTGDQFRGISFAPVALATTPEPASIGLLSLGAAGLLVRRRGAR